MAAAPLRRRCEHDDASYDPTQTSFFFILSFICLFISFSFFPSHLSVFDHPKNRSCRPFSSLFSFRFISFLLLLFFSFLVCPLMERRGKRLGIFERD